MQRTTVRLPVELLARARRKASDEGRTLTSLVEEGLRSVVAGPTATPERVMPPVSSARGGFAPGLAGIFPSELQEADDLASMAEATRADRDFARFPGLRWRRLEGA